MTSRTDNNGFLKEWNITSVAVGLSIIWFAIIFIQGGFNEEANRIAIRLSARIAAVLFSLAFGASAFWEVSKNELSKWLLKNRKYIGVSFAIIHLIHLVFLIILQQNFHPVFERAKTISLLGGGLAYIFVVLMLITSFPRFSKDISPRNWKILHILGGYWIWYIFIRSYVKRVDTEIEYLPLVILLMLVMALRFWKVWKGWKK